MCGRMHLGELDVQFLYRLSPSELPKVEPHYNIPPGYQEVLCLKGEPATYGLAQWGLIPSFIKGKSPRPFSLARDDGLEKTWPFKLIFPKKRCIVFANGFYEWKEEAGVKVPHYFHLKNQKLFGMAGLWDRWISPEGEVMESCAVITTEANEIVASVHAKKRMPVILTEEEIRVWLDPKTELKTLKSLLKPFPNDEMDCYRVDRRVNRASFDSEECIRRLASS